jgi:hypothetical protein
MRDVIDYLESVACHGASESSPEHAGRLDRLPVEVRASIVKGDADALRHALGLPAVMACMITAPGEDDDGFDEQPVAPDELPDDAQTQAA